MGLMTVEAIKFWVKICNVDKEHFLWGNEGAWGTSFGLWIIALASFLLTWENCSASI